MDEEPPPPTDSPPATSPQPAVDSSEEKHPSILQCEEFSTDAAAEEPDRSNEESSIPIVQCPEPQSDDGGERRSVAADGEENPAAVEDENPALRQEEKEADGGVVEFEPSVDEIMQENVEERLIVDDRPQPTEEVNGNRPEIGKGDDGIKAPILEASICNVTADEVAERYIEEQILDADGSQPAEELNGERPQVGAQPAEELNGERSQVGTYLVREHEEEDKGPISETGTLDEIMHENVEEKLLDVDCLQPTEHLNGERLQVAEEGERAYTLEKPWAGDEKVSSSEEESEEKEEEKKVPLFNEIMPEKIMKKPQDCNEKEPTKQLEEEKLHEEVSSLQAKGVGEEEKLVMSELSGSVAEGEDDEHKPSEEQLNEEKPELVKKRKKASSARRRLLEEEEDEKTSSLQEESAAGVQDESAEKDEEESDEKEDADEMDTDDGGPARAAGKRTGSKRKRGRPPVAQGRRTRAPPRPKEDEELCFICFDGGDLVVCDHRGCPKVYHPSCVNRDEAYFKAKGQWTCGWHICSNCQKSSRYNCYTCTYSLCRRCIKESEFVCVRETKGFCETCMKIVMQIEMNTRADENTDAIDFDDKTSWMYLFKDYWVDLKAKLSLTIDELIGAKNPFKDTNAVSGNDEPLDKKGTAQWNGEPSEKPGSPSDDQGGSSSGSSRRHKECTSSKKKAKKRLRNTANKERSSKEVGTKRTSTSKDIEWASKELLEFVAHMKDGDRSVLSQFDVQALLLEYIKQNNLRDPRRKSQVVCDSRLQALFGKSRVGHLEMLKLLEPHFLIKESSPLATDDNQGGVVDPDPSQTDVEGISDASTKLSLDTGRRSRRRVEERGPAKLDDYAAIDVHNVRLMYLRRNLMEGFLDDVDTFNENVVGSFVRIRISGSASNKDMYRLVQVIGTGKAGEGYKTGKKATDITLEILNLNKREFITIDLISNQEFTEEECKRLRQSVKCGFIHRPTVAEVQEKARALHAVKFDDWLESEKLRLGHLRDRASEKGRIKEHRECVEKLQLLNTPEERIKRLNEVPEVHIDPNRDLDCDSTEDEDDLNIKRQDNNRMRNSLFKDRDEFLARRGCSAPWKNSRAQDSNRSAVKPGAQNVVPPPIPAGKTDGFARDQEDNVNQVSSPKTPKAGTNVTSIVSSAPTNALPVIEPGKLSGVQSETAPQPMSANVVSSSVSETEKMWHYQDPAGKIQGPFSMTQLRKWNTSGFFPTILRIWRTSEKQENSILLTDALSGKFHKDMQCLEPHHSNTSQPASGTVMADTRVNNMGGGLRENNIHHNSASFPTTGSYSAQSDRWTAQTSPLSPDTGRVGPMDRRPATSSTGWESSKNSNALCGQSQSYNSPRSVSPFSRNSQPPSFHGRDGRGENHGRWNGAQGRQNNWNSNKHRRFQNNSRGYERQHSYQGSSGQQSSEHWKVQPVNNSSTPLGNSSNPPTHAPQPNSIDWASLQGAINRILPSACPGQPMSSGPCAIPRSGEVQQSQANLTSMPMNAVGGWALNSISNVNPGMTQETVGVLSNAQPQNRPSETAALVTSRNHAVYNGSSTTESVDRSNMKLGSDNSNTKPITEQVSCDVQDSGSIQPANSQSNVPGVRTVPSNEPDTNKKCPESHDMSASENKNVDGTDKALHAACVAGDASGSSAQASLSVQRSEASSSKAQTGSQCWTPVSTQKEGPTSLSVNSAQPLNMGWGTAPQNPNPCTGTVQQIGNMVYPAVPGAANMGWGMMAHGVMNMSWGAPTNMNMGWVPPAQSPMNVNLGWAVPAQGNANANMTWGAQTQANSNAGWGVPMQVNSAQNPGWVAPSTVSANPNPCWVAPMEGNANQNTSWGTAMKSAQGSMDGATNQNGGAGKTNSNGDGGSSHPPLPPEQGGVCRFHEGGHCKKGASCNYIHS